MEKKISLPVFSILGRNTLKHERLAKGSQFSAGIKRREIVLRADSNLWTEGEGGQ